MQLDKLILSNLIYNELYNRKVLIEIKSDYFNNRGNKIVFELIQSFVNKYNSLPTKEILFIDLSNITNIHEKDFNEAQQVISSLEPDNTSKFDWLLDQTEKFCQEKAVYNALLKSIEIADSKNSTSSDAKGLIPHILSEALSVSFNKSIGHEFLESAESRYESYHTVENKIPFDIDIFNTVTKGGISNKTLTIFMAASGVGKSMMMVHMAAYNLIYGKNVLYVSLEMSEDKIAERIDMNLLDMTQDQIMTLSKEKYIQKIVDLKSKTLGRLIIKEYPQTTMSALTLKHLLNELKLKKNFIPDIVYVDYINLCASSRLKLNSGANSYTYVKAVAEEIRGIAAEFDIPIVTATQVNRVGYNNSDIGMENVADSIGLVNTADYMFALISTEELESLGQIMIKRLKDRYNDPRIFKKFVVGIDRSKMKLFNIELDQQELSHDIDSLEYNDTIFDEKQINFDGFK